MGTASSNKYGSRGRSCAVVRSRACVVGHAWSPRTTAVPTPPPWSCVVVPFCPLRGQHCRGTNERTYERTTSNNPLNAWSPRTTAVPTRPPWGGVGTASSNKYGSRGRSCVVVRVRAWSVMRGRACVIGHAWSCAVGRAWSCGRVVLPASRPALLWHERTNEQHLITP